MLDAAHELNFARLRMLHRVSQETNDWRNPYQKGAHHYMPHSWQLEEMQDEISALSRELAEEEDP
jgi:hypothetical protein